MTAGVGVTDAQWAAFLRDRPQIREANFWVPNPRPTWWVADQGSPWLFKTRWPSNQIVGVGFVSGHARLRVSEAWEFFGEGNGVASEAALLAAIQHYRKDRDPDPLIGCALLRDLVFAGRAASLPVSRSGCRRAPLRGHRRQDPAGTTAAHIRAVAAGGQNRVDNGLLLRSDVHTLFDRGYLGVDQHYRLQVSPRLRAQFGNGEEFYSRAGEEAAMPRRRIDWPARDAVSWHMDTVFRR